MEVFLINLVIQHGPSHADEMRCRLCAMHFDGTEANILFFDRQKTFILEYLS